MKRFFLNLACLAVALPALAQGPRQPMPENVILTRQGSLSLVYGGPTRAEGRSYNFTPVFLVFPDGKLDKAGAEAFLHALDMQSVLDDNYGNVMVINPTGDKFTPADFDVFVQMFNMLRPSNLKVMGFGDGATFVNQVVVPQAAGSIAGVLTVGGKPAKRAAPDGVPAYVAGKGASKAARPYQEAVAAHPGEPLLQTVVTDLSEPAAVFADAWDKVFSRNFRYNNEKHTYYNGARFGEYGAYELEPYAEHERLGIKRLIVEQPAGQGPDAAKYLWYEYWPEELLEGAPEKSVPMVVLLHGNTNDPRTQAETSGFLQVAAEDRFMLVEMEWQGSPNYAALGIDGVESVIRILQAKNPQLDPGRVYAEGLSAGSMTATALGIKKSHVFTAVGGHSGGLASGRFLTAFPTFETIWPEATQKRGAIETPYCSVFGTADTVVPYITPDNWQGNGYFNAWNAYRQMNGLPLLETIDFSLDPVFGQRLDDRETIVTNKGNGIVMETGQLRKDGVPLIKLVAVMDYGHWNFQPTARVMWDFFRQFRRDASGRLVYEP